MFTSLAMAALAVFAPLQQQVPPTGEIRGIVRSEATGERLPYSVIELIGPDGALVTLADSLGIYTARGLPAGTRILRASRFDHAPLEIEVLVAEDRVVNLDLMLVPRPVALPEITARIRNTPRLSDTTRAAVPDLGMAVTHTIDATPGVAELGFGHLPSGIPGQTPIDPSDVLYVRGSPSDLKLVLIDGAPVYAPFHLGGLIQPFDPALLRSAELYLGGAPARYDGGLSYVLGLESRAGNRGRYQTTGAVDLLSSALTVEGPLPFTRRAGFLVGGRNVHPYGSQWFLGRGFPYEYTDALARIDADVGDEGSIALTGFWNHESIRWSKQGVPDSVARWGNGAASLRYRGRVPGGTGDFTAAYGDYRTRVPLSGHQPALADGRARRIRLAADLVREADAARFHYGLSYERLSLDYHAMVSALDKVEVVDASAAGEVAGAYFETDWQPAQHWRIRGGARIDLFSSDPVPRAAPRLSVTWLVSDRASLTLAAGRYRQFIRSIEPVLRDGPGSKLQSLYSSTELAIARASHVVLGLDQELGDGVRLGIEGFFKDFADLPPVYADSADHADDDRLPRAERAGATASGIDVWLRRGEGRLTGWLGYSLSWIWSADDARVATPRFSGRQLLSVGLSGPIGEMGRFDLRVAYGAGLPYSAIPSIEAADGVQIPFSNAPHPIESSYRNVAVNAPPYADAPDEPYLRVDLEVSHPWKAEWGSREVTFSPYIKILNALDRRDALFYRVTAPGEEPEPLAALPVLPVLGFRWTF
jgi:hypothetical protein